MSNNKIDLELYEILYDKDGNEVIRPRMYTSKKDPNGSSTFTTFDSSAGHCNFCGSLQCHGKCFK